LMSLFTALSITLNAVSPSYVSSLVSLAAQGTIVENQNILQVYSQMAAIPIDIVSRLMGAKTSAKDLAKKQGSPEKDAGHKNQNSSDLSFVPSHLAERLTRGLEGSYLCIPGVNTDIYNLRGWYYLKFPLAACGFCIILMYMLVFLVRLRRGSLPAPNIKLLTHIITQSLEIKKDWVFYLNDRFGRAGRLSRWVNFTRFCALVTLASFLITSIFPQGAGAFSKREQSTKVISDILGSFEIPYSVGRVTAAKCFRGSKTVINIQDLHCHGEVQKNISRILSLIDEKCGFKKIYIEGAEGVLDTSWINEIRDEKLRASVIDCLVESGRLNGAEYYSMVSNKPKLLQGMEDKKVYDANIVRLNKMINGKAGIDATLMPSLKSEVERIKGVYFSQKNLRIERMTGQYRTGEISAKKYYKILQKLTLEAGIDISAYENISKFLSILRMQKRLNYPRITAELNAYMNTLKYKLSYMDYIQLQEKTKDISRLDELYLALSKITKELNFKNEQGYGELKEFFEFVDANQKINPMQLVGEEKALLAELLNRCAQSGSEREIVFISNFVGVLDDYFNNRISSQDLSYFKQNLPRFTLLWKKYADAGKLAPVNEYSGLFDRFYEANLDRNRFFVENIFGKTLNAPKTAIASLSDDAETMLAKLNSSDDIYVVITGGFHTPGFTKLLSGKGISYIVITPNVTKDTKYSDSIYEELVREHAKILSQSIPPGVLTDELASMAPAQRTKFLLTASVQGKIRELADGGRDADEIINDVRAFVSEYGRSTGNSAVFGSAGVGLYTLTVNGEKHFFSVKGNIVKLVDSESPAGFVPTVADNENSVTGTGSSMFPVQDMHSSERGAPATLSSSRWFGNLFGRNAVTDSIDELLIAPVAELGRFAKISAIYIEFIGHQRSDSVAERNEYRDKYEIAVKDFYRVHGYDTENTRQFDFFAVGMNSIMLQAAGSRFKRLSLVSGHFIYNLTARMSKRDLPSMTLGGTELAEYTESSAEVAAGDAYAVSEKVLKLASENYLLLGNGLIYEIAGDPELSERFTIDGIKQEILSRFPDLAQRIIAEREKRNIGLAETAKRSEWLKLLLAAELLNGLLAEIAARPAQVIALTKQTPGRESAAGSALTQPLSGTPELNLVKLVKPDTETAGLQQARDIVKMYGLGSMVSAQGLKGGMGAGAGKTIQPMLVETTVGKRYVIRVIQAYNGYLKSRILEFDDVKNILRDDYNFAEHLINNGFKIVSRIYLTTGGVPYAVYDQKISVSDFLMAEGIGNDRAKARAAYEKYLDTNKFENWEIAGKGEDYITVRRLVTVSEFKEGEDADWGDFRGDLLENAAATLARYHYAAMGFEGPGLKKKPSRLSAGAMGWTKKLLNDAKNKIEEKKNSNEPLSGIEKYFIDSLFPKDGVSIIDRIDEAVRNVERLTNSQPALMRVVTHGDFHPKNVKVKKKTNKADSSSFKGNEIVGLFDFDFAMEDLRVADFLQGVLPDDASEDMVWMFLRAYQREAGKLGIPLSENEIRMFFELRKIKYIGMLGWLGEKNKLETIEHNPAEINWYKAQQRSLEEWSDLHWDSMDKQDIMDNLNPSIFSRELPQATATHTYEWMARLFGWYFARFAKPRLDLRWKGDKEGKNKDGKRIEQWFEGDSAIKNASAVRFTRFWFAPVWENTRMLVMPWTFGAAHKQYSEAQQQALTRELAWPAAKRALAVGVAAGIVAGLATGSVICGLGLGTVAWFAAGAVIHANYNRRQDRLARLARQIQMGELPTLTRAERRIFEDTLTQAARYHDIFENAEQQDIDRLPAVIDPKLGISQVDPVTGNAINEREVDFLTPDNVVLKLSWKDRIISNLLTVIAKFPVYKQWAENKLNILMRANCKIDHRSSPTNIGLAILNSVMEWQSGKITAEEANQKIRNMVTVVERLPKYKGHLYNWYNSQTLSVYEEHGDKEKYHLNSNDFLGFISSIDSGNLAAFLLITANSITDTELKKRILKIVRDMDFGMLYDKSRGLFYVGGLHQISSRVGNEFNPSEGHYDVLLGEGRIASVVAIAKGEVPRDQMDHMKRHMAGTSEESSGSPAMSYFGTSMETSLAGSIFRETGAMLGEVHRIMTRRQVEAGIYGVMGQSETAWDFEQGSGHVLYGPQGVKANAMNHEDKNFGRIYSPYAAMLEAPWAPEEAAKALKNYKKLGMGSPIGLCESVEFTKDGKTLVTPVVFVHHTAGMGAIALFNLDSGGYLQEKFHSNPFNTGAVFEDELKDAPADLIAKGLIKQADVYYVVTADRETIQNAKIDAKTKAVLLDALSRIGVVEEALDTRKEDIVEAAPQQVSGLDLEMAYQYKQHLGEPVPDCVEGHLGYTVNASAKGGGSSWMGEEVQYYNRVFYVKDITSGKMLPVGLKPLDTKIVRGKIVIPGFIELPEGKIEVVVTGTASKEDSAEVWDIKITNNTGVKRDIDITGYLEWVMDNMVAWKDATIFRKLTLGADYDPSLKVITAQRRVTGPERDKQHSGVFFIADNNRVDGHAESRLNFIGRLRNLAHPIAMDKGLVPGTSDVRDPAAALSRRVSIAGGKSATITFVMANAADKNEVKSLTEKYRNRDYVEKQMSLAEVSAPAQALRRDGRVKSFMDWFAHNAQRQWRMAREPRVADEAKKETGHFSENGRAYIVDDPSATGKPFSQVVANKVYGFLATAGGSIFSFNGNAQQKRVTAAEPDAVTEEPMRGVIVKDADTGKEWSIAQNPRTDKDAKYRTEMGQGYVKYIYEKEGEWKITMTMFVSSSDEPVEFWDIDVEYTGERSSQGKNIEIGSFLKWALSRNYNQATDNTSTEVRHETVIAKNPDALIKDSVGFHCVVADNAAAVRATDDVFGAKADPFSGVSVKLNLNASNHYKTRVTYMLGMTENDADGAKASALMAKYRNRANITETFDKGQKEWNDYLDDLKVETPDNNFNRMTDWMRYQGVVWSYYGKTGYYQAGGAFGFRDQLQTVFAMASSGNPADVKRAEEHIIRCAGRQFPEGDVLGWWHDFGKDENGKDINFGVRTKISDHYLWLPFAAAQVIGVSGDMSLLDTRVPYLSGNQIPADRNDYVDQFKASDIPEQNVSIYEHCVRSIERSLSNMGEHGLPLIGAGDWNDGLDEIGIKGRGETVWGAFFLYKVLVDFAAIARTRGDIKTAARYEAEAAKLSANIEKFAQASKGLTKKWFVRAFTDSGSRMEKLDAIPQAWSVISGAVGGKLARKALWTALDELYDEDTNIIRLFDKPVDRQENENFPVGHLGKYFPGDRENGGQYTHGVNWLVYALALYAAHNPAEANKGKYGDLLWKVAKVLNPTEHAKKANYRGEPYIAPADVSPKGVAGWTGYTGSTGWILKTMLEGMLGLRFRDGNRLYIDPVLPVESWGKQGYTVTKKFGTARYKIQVTNPDQVSIGVNSIKLDGLDIDPSKGVELRDDGREHRIAVVMGKPAVRNPPSQGNELPLTAAADPLEAARATVVKVISAVSTASNPGKTIYERLNPVSTIAPELLGKNYLLFSNDSQNIEARVKQRAGLGLNVVGVAPLGEMPREGMKNLGDLSKAEIPGNNGDNILVDVWAKNVTADNGNSAWVLYYGLPAQCSELTASRAPLAVAELLKTNIRVQQELGLDRQTLSWGNITRSYYGRENPFGIDVIETDDPLNAPETAFEGMNGHIAMFRGTVRILMSKRALTSGESAKNKKVFDMVSGADEQLAPVLAFAGSMTKIRSAELGISKSRVNVAVVVELPLSGKLDADNFKRHILALKNNMGFDTVLLKMPPDRGIENIGIMQNAVSELQAQGVRVFFEYKVINTDLAPGDISAISKTGVQGMQINLTGITSEIQAKQMLLSLRRVNPDIQISVMLADGLADNTELKAICLSNNFVEAQQVEISKAGQDRVTQINKIAGKIWFQVVLPRSAGEVDNEMLGTFFGCLETSNAWGIAIPETQDENLDGAGISPLKNSLAGIIRSRLAQIQAIPQDPYKKAYDTVWNLDADEVPELTPVAQSAVLPLLAACNSGKYDEASEYINKIAGSLQADQKAFRTVRNYYQHLQALIEGANGREKEENIKAAAGSARAILERNLCDRYSDKNLPLASKTHRQVYGMSLVEAVSRVGLVAGDTYDEAYTNYAKALNVTSGQSPAVGVIVEKLERLSDASNQREAEQAATESIREVLEMINAGKLNIKDPAVITGLIRLFSFAQKNVDLKEKIKGPENAAVVSLEAMLGAG